MCVYYVTLDVCCFFVLTSFLLMLLLASCVFFFFFFFITSSSSSFFPIFCLSSFRTLESNSETTDKLCYKNVFHRRCKIIRCYYGRACIIAKRKGKDTCEKRCSLGTAHASCVIRIIYSLAIFIVLK
jgi:hypothetical protein